jgi:hypothetical protein
MNFLINRIKAVLLVVILMVVGCAQQLVKAGCGCPCPTPASCSLILTRPASGGVGVLGYGYIYNLTPIAVVGVDTAIPFGSNGPLLGVTHTAGSTNITVTSAGTYAVLFSVSATEPNQFALWVNGVYAAGTRYGSGAGTQQNTGLSILTLAAGDVLTLVNDAASGGNVSLAPTVGGTGVNVNASVLIIRLA